MPQHPPHLQLLPRRWDKKFNLPALLGLLLTTAVVILIVLVALSTHMSNQRVRLIRDSLNVYEFDALVEKVFSTLKDTETGQRGYLLTRQWAYRIPYEDAKRNLNSLLTKLEQNPTGKATHSEDIARLVQLTRAKLAELNSTLDAADTGNFDKALAIVYSDQGLQLMQEIRDVVQKIQKEDETQLQEQYQSIAARHHYARWLTPLVILLSFLMSIGAFAMMAYLYDRGKKVEGRLRHFNNQLAMANNDLKSFSYSVAHDLRAPVRTINSFVNDLLINQSDQFSPEVVQSLNHVVTSGTHMSHLINDLLTLSRVSTVEMKREKIDMYALVRSVCDELLAAAHAANEGQQSTHQIQLNIDKTLPPTHGDATLIRQVWTNLVDNALKFTKTKPIAVIEIGGATAGPEFVTYFIRDNGIGFDMRHLDRLFSPFQQLHPDDRLEGSGIGLALVHRIIQHHGGTIWAEAKENEGAFFAFTLPES